MHWWCREAWGRSGRGPTGGECTSESDAGKAAPGGARRAAAGSGTPASGALLTLGISGVPLPHRFRLQGSPGQTEPPCISLSYSCSLNHVCQTPSLPRNTCSHRFWA